MNKWLSAVLYLGFISVGMVASIIGPIAAAAKAEFSLNFSQSGALISAQSIGMLFVALTCGHLADRYGKKPFLLAGGALLIAGLLGSMFSVGFYSLLISTLIAGAGFGVYEIGINALCVDYASSGHASAMNFLHFFFSVGAMVGPLVATLCTTVFGSWRYTFGFILIFPLIVSGILLRLELPKSQGSSDEPSGMVGLLRNPYIWLAGILTFFYVGLEVTSYGWLPVYWNSEVLNPIIPGALTATIFWAALTVGRLLSGKVADRIGSQRFVLAASALVVLTTGVWAFTKAGNGLILVVIALGLLFAGIFPTNLAGTMTRFPGNSGSISSLIMIFASMGGAVLPAVIGKNADVIGISKMPFLIFGFTFFLLGFAFLTYKKAQKK